MTTVKEKTKQHVIFRLLRKKQNDKIVDLIKKMSKDELINLRTNENIPLIQYVVTEMNYEIFTELIDKCGEEILNVKLNSEKYDIFQIFCRQCCKYKNIDIRENFFNDFLKFNNINYSGILKEIFIDHTFSNWLLRIIKKDPSYLNVFKKKLYHTLTHMVNINNILEKILICLSSDGKFEKKITTILDRLIRWSNLSLDDIDMFFKYCKIENIDKSIIELTIFNKKKDSFDFYFEKMNNFITNKELINKITLMFLFNLFDDPKLFEGIPKYFDYNPYEIEFKKYDFPTISKIYPVVKEMIEDMIFRTTDIHYLRKLLDSPIPRNWNIITAKLIKSLVVPFRFPRMEELTMDKIHSLPDSDKYNEQFHAFQEIKSAIKQHYCINCAKKYSRYIYDMNVCIVTNNVTIDYVFARNSIVEYELPMIMKFTGFSFCSSSCELEFNNLIQNTDYWKS